MSDYNIYELLNDRGYRRIRKDLHEKKRRSSWGNEYPNRTQDEKIMLYLADKCQDFDTTWFHFKDRVLRTHKSGIVRSIYYIVREAGI